MARADPVGHCRGQATGGDSTNRPFFAKMPTPSTGEGMEPEWVMKTDHKKIEGWWKILSLRWDGQDLGGLDTVAYLFHEGRAVLFDRMANTREECAYRLDTRCTPRQFHLLRGQGRADKICVYAFEGDDVLLLCESGIPHTPPPDSVSSEAGDDRRLLRLARIPRAASSPDE